MQNQADKLVELMQQEKVNNKENKHTKVIAITSGKGGVGKSTVSANIANLLAKNNYKVALFDADIGLANLDVILNVKIGKNLLHVLKGECSLKDIIKEVKTNLLLIPGDSGGEILKLANSSYFEMLLNDSQLLNDLDFLIIDTGAGISETTMHFLSIADEVVIVTTPDPAAITDAYATIKVSSNSRKDFSMLINIAKNEKEALNLYTNISRVANTNIKTNPEISYLGYLQSSQNIIDCIKSRELFTDKISSDTRNLKNALNTLLAKMERNVLSSESNITNFFKRLMDRF
ncbi:P-loop NTPase [Campylobacter canadensis]|uniref:P-loop NTPase n=1 Tax=Campylobacter canadensis TaxID=449520 RepID=A0ABS7WVI8_9BACT|nr:P-loop NTPase [Campylobacter canadensis]MBZ7988054.1 P-loop NTPase [Campylobacter canadensis]MBZ7995487.1 P-loop NTPase [Campylobacter canadensis]MBZ7997295.1 P-loop NTPase [Campylobacter canadensis]MBZ7999017.1 P-loop NTPase [Campylobacter canadensis]MBZ8000823.1 P-loop NTPase [Campylobacter canadensis]